MSNVAGLDADVFVYGAHVLVCVCCVCVLCVCCVCVLCVCVVCVCVVCVCCVCVCGVCVCVCVVCVVCVCVVCVVCVCVVCVLCVLCGVCYNNSKFSQLSKLIYTSVLDLDTANLCPLVGCYIISISGHVIEEEQDVRIGVELLTSTRPKWICSPLGGHISWHLALYYLGT